MVLSSQYCDQNFNSQFLPKLHRSFINTTLYPQINLIKEKAKRTDKNSHRSFSTDSSSTHISFLSSFLFSFFVFSLSPIALDCVAHDREWNFRHKQALCSPPVPYCRKVHRLKILHTPDIKFLYISGQRNCPILLRETANFTDSSFSSKTNMAAVGGVVAVAFHLILQFFQWTPCMNSAEYNPVLCMQHCTNQFNIFFTNFPEFCPICGLSLRSCSLLIPPFRLPSPFVSNISAPCSVLVKPTDGTFLR